MNKSRGVHLKGRSGVITARSKSVGLAVLISIALSASLLLAAVPVCTADQEMKGKLSPEQRTALYLESIRTSPGELRAFFLAMPKGGDIHSHLQGAAYAEDIIDLGAKKGLCVDKSTYSLSFRPCNPNRTLPASRAYEDADMYDRLVDEWSVRRVHSSNWTLYHRSSAIFKKTGPALDDYCALVSVLRSRAAKENVQYIETMVILTPQTEAASSLGRSIGWDDNLTRLHSRLMESGIRDLAENASLHLLEYDNESKSILKCRASQKDGGCSVDVRYQYCAQRTASLEEVFAQLALAFEVAEQCPLVVGVNLVGSEDDWISRHDYSLHMKMIGFLHGIHPDIRIGLNAGELAQGSVPPEDLKFHISEAVSQGNASRIGHGASIMEESCSQDILEKMARQAVAVEITPASSKTLLGISYGSLPLAIYVDHGVPVVLGSDYPGTLRTDLSEQFVLATEQYPGINYSEIKRFVRNSLEYSFLPGSSLWAERGDYSRVVSACASEAAGAEELSPECLECLDSSEKATAQWRLEGDLAYYEYGFEAVQVLAPQPATPETIKNVTEIGVPREIKHSVYKECSCCG